MKASYSNRERLSSSAIFFNPIFESSFPCHLFASIARSSNSLRNNLPCAMLIRIARYGYRNGDRLSS